MHERVRPPKAVFFDWDGTLVDSFSFLQDIHGHVLKDMEMPAREDGWFHRYFGKERDWIYQDIYGDRQAQARKLFATYLVENHVNALTLMDGAQEVLDVLRAHNIVCGVVTNKQGDWVRREIAAFGWESYFAAVVGAGEAAHDKPHYAPLEKAVIDAGLEVQADEVWFIGDTEADLSCARGYGAPSILIHGAPESEPWVEGYDPYMVFSDCRALHVFLLQNLSKSLQKRAK